jgi:hypothetical protein
VVTTGTTRFNIKTLRFSHGMFVEFEITLQSKQRFFPQAALTTGSKEPFLCNFKLDVLRIKCVLIRIKYVKVFTASILLQNVRNFRYGKLIQLLACTSFYLYLWIIYSFLDVGIYLFPLS